MNSVIDLIENMNFAATCKKKTEYIAHIHTITNRWLVEKINMLCCKWKDLSDYLFHAPVYRLYNIEQWFTFCEGLSVSACTMNQFPGWKIGCTTWAVQMWKTLHLVLSPSQRSHQWQWSFRLSNCDSSSLEYIVACQAHPALVKIDLTLAGLFHLMVC